MYIYVHVHMCVHVQYMFHCLHCSIDVWEVFILLSRLNDDWGWGRSQRTGESGLIPLMIMEDVVRVGGGGGGGCL